MVAGCRSRPDVLPRASPFCSPRSSAVKGWTALLLASAASVGIQAGELHRRKGIFPTRRTSWCSYLCLLGCSTGSKWLMDRIRCRFYWKWSLGFDFQIFVKDGMWRYVSWMLKAWIFHYLSNAGVYEMFQPILSTWWLRVPMDHCWLRYLIPCCA